MDGPFIRAGSRSAVNGRVAVYVKDEWHNEDQLGPLIYLLLTGKGHGIGRENRTVGKLNWTLLQ